MNNRKKTMGVLCNLDVIIAGVALVILVLVTFAGVVMRRAFNNPLIWQEEVQIWCFIWITFFAAGAAFRYGSHVSIEIIVDLFPKKIQKIVEFIDYAVVMVILVYLFLKGMSLVEQLATSGRLTNILGIPYPVLYGAMPIGCILMIINYTSVMINELFLKRDNNMLVQGEVEVNS